ncbi:protein of unknown function [Mesotoga infera]|jgi:hypothetical protein|uniref:Uncharacterized protein n=1 Tax=Mesotoga infera TaxID=1236046 RepID=A0A7Z7LFK7_9BACT|nr:protein of unknown function [Mesotoga infera]
MMIIASLIPLFIVGFVIAEIVVIIYSLALIIKYF